MDSVVPTARKPSPSLRPGTPPVVAVVEDDPTTRAVVRRWLERFGYEVREYSGGQEVLDDVERAFHAICLDIGLSDMSGIEVLDKLQSLRPEIPVIVATAHGDAETAVQAMRAGAYEYLVKPLDPSQFEHAVARAVERSLLARKLHRLRTALDDRRVLGSIVGESPVMRELARQAERVLDSDVAVCIFGESGTGKELVARAIHAGGRRQNAPFVAINCAAIPEALQESELFGHERGAFTGAAQTHRGRFEQASGGTLFLDELGEMSASTQANLLRTLQERTIRRVGGMVEIPVDVRIVCATHRDLADEVRKGRFREDLYFRLVVYPLQVPPLRDRKEDIPLLVSHFIHKLAPDVGREVTRVSAEVLDALGSHAWPGNVRELQNVVHRALLACDGEELTLEHLPPTMRDFSQPSTVRESMPAVSRPSDPPVVPMRELEKRAIQRALKLTNGSVGKAAQLLGMGRATLYRRLNEFGVTGAN